MKKKAYSIMQSQHNLSRVLREVKAGYEVEITRRKVPVARMLPVDDGTAVDFPDFTARARAIWKTPWRGASSSALLDEARGSR